MYWETHLVNLGYTQKKGVLQMSFYKRVIFSLTLFVAFKKQAILAPPPFFDRALMLKLTLLLVGLQKSWFTTVKRPKYAWFGHVGRHKNLLNSVLQGYVEGRRRQVKLVGVRDEVNNPPSDRPPNRSTRQFLWRALQLLSQQVSPTLHTPAPVGPLIRKSW